MINLDGILVFATKIICQQEEALTHFMGIIRAQKITITIFISQQVCRENNAKQLKYLFNKRKDNLIYPGIYIIIIYNVYC